MRILQVSSLWPPSVLGGAEIYAERLLQELRRRNHDVAVVTFGVPGPDVAGMVRPWPYRLDTFGDQPVWRRGLFQLVDLYNPAAAKRVRTTIDMFRPDVVHSHAVGGMSAATMTAGASRAPHVHHLHDYWLLCRRTTLAAADGRPCIRRCGSCVAISSVRNRTLERCPPDLVVAPSNAVASAHQSIRWMGERLRRLDHPVDIPEGTWPRTFVAGPQRFGFIGQVSRPKGVLTLLEAFRPLSANGHTLTIAGRGPLDEIVGSAGPGVAALGFVNGKTKEAFFRGIDCLVVPSEWRENAPLVVLEARARGLPVIATRIGGLPELIDAASAPLLVSAGDPAALRLAMTTFAREPGHFAPGTEPVMGWEQHVRQLETLYDEALRRARFRLT
ncbi:MAG: glycosyltransferase family 4 protein [Acidimicrobiales bacterium]